MILTLYEPFRHWSETGSVYILSDPHLGDSNCKLMDPGWIEPEEQVTRLRRSLSAELVAERAGISRASLWKVEKGEPSVAMGIYAAVLHALNNLDKDLLLVAKDDEMGRQLQDLNLITRKRAPRRSK